MEPILLITIDPILKASIGTFFAAGLTYLGNWLYWRNTKQKLLLHYSVIESIVFPLGAEEVKLYNIIIKNKGEDPIEDLKVIIKFQKGKIKEWKIRDHFSNADIKHTEHDLNFGAQFLNQKQEIDCVILVKEDDDATTSTVKVTAHGKGATATSKSEIEKRPILVRLTVAGLVGLAIGMLVGYYAFVI